MVLLLLVVAVAGSGIGRLKLDPDILGILPPELPEVRGLRAYHEGFARRDEIVILLESEDAENLPIVAREVAELLEKGTVKRARWQPDWENQGDGLAELLAYFWLNGPPESVAELAKRLSPENAAAALAERVAGVATALEGEDLAMQANDPLGLLEHPSVRRLIGDAGVSEGFSSADGTAHIVLVEAPAALNGYKDAGRWVEQVKNMLLREQPEHWKSVRFSFTGEPVFSAEIGGAMERDMSSTVGITMGLIALIFWWMQRRFMLLLGLMVVLALVFVATLGIGGWFFSDGVSVMAVGFAAILIGLAVDYGVLICQEAKHAGHDRKKLARAVTASLAWAALTTAVVFAFLHRSGMPGLAQLGILVACGILAGAALMLGLYLPFVAKMGAGREGGQGGFCPVPEGKAGIAGGIAVLLVAVAVIFAKGFPSVSFDSALMRPENSQAMVAFERLKEEFPEWGADDVKLVISGKSDAEVLAHAGRAEKIFRSSEMLRVSIPAGVFPDAEAQRKNRSGLEKLVVREGEITAAASSAGFSDQGLGLARSVIGQWRKMLARDGLVFPRDGIAREMLGLMVSRQESGGGKLLGTVKPAAGTWDDAALEEVRTAGGDGVLPAGWELLRPALAPMVRKDVRDLLLPMAGLMVALLALAFRSAREVACCMAALVLCSVFVIAIMAVCGIGWNFLNIAAAPLLLGMGIDYFIHVGLALKRNGRDVKEMWESTGKAVVFCAVSTAIGFGSLCWASNKALASLGAVAVTGTFACMAVALFLLPSWWPRTAAAENSAPRH